MWLERRSVSASSLAAVIVLTSSGLAGCSPSLSDTDEPPAASSGRESFKHGPSAAASKPPSKKADTTTERWVCFYDPTFNRNWHDDVLCTKGAKSVRPSLRPNDRFITEGEMMSAAREYEKKLNKRR